jgi:hypothetical protein
MEVNSTLKAIRERMRNLEVYSSMATTAGENNSQVYRNAEEYYSKNLLRPGPEPMYLRCRHMGVCTGVVQCLEKPHERAI